MTRPFAYENRHFFAFRFDESEPVSVVVKWSAPCHHSAVYAGFLIELQFAILKVPRQRPRSGIALRLNGCDYQAARGFLSAGCTPLQSFVPECRPQDGQSVLLQVPRVPLHFVGGSSGIQTALRVLDEERLISGVSEIGRSLPVGEAEIESDSRPPEALRPQSFVADGVSRNWQPSDLESILSVAGQTICVWRRDGASTSLQPSAGGMYARSGFLLRLSDSGKGLDSRGTFEVYEICRSGRLGRRSVSSHEEWLTFKTATREQREFENCRLYFIPVFDLTAYCDRYGARGLRFMHLECGALLQNFCRQIEQLGFGTRWLGGFDDTLISHALGLKPEEMVSCFVGLK